MTPTFRPMIQWPPWAMPVPRTFKRGAFRAQYPATVKMLANELKHLRAESAVVLVRALPSEFKAGRLPATANPFTPGVCLTVQRGSMILGFSCQTYHSWKDNLRAIALLLKSLRSLATHGWRSEQYAGFRLNVEPPEAKPEPQQSEYRYRPEPPNARPTSDARTAAILIGGFAIRGGFPLHFADAVEILVGNPDIYRRAYKAAARTVHPDRCGGSDREFKQLQAAAAVLDRHHGV